MELELNIPLGIIGCSEKTVTYEDTAAVWGSGLLEVFSTPSLVALMEGAAYESLLPYLPQGVSTVGTAMDAKHVRATPIGKRVCAKAKLVNTDRRALTFEINAFDDQGEIGHCIHERFVIDIEKFLGKL